MKKRNSPIPIVYGVALSALLVASAGAQTNSVPAGTTAAPTAEQARSVGKPQFVAAQRADQWLASNFKGTEVIGADGKKIGAVTDILFDRSGKIDAYVVSVGGFLGMGAKEVALTPGSFDVVPGANGGTDRLKLSVGQDELKQAQNFAPYTPPRPATTGAAPGGIRPQGGALTGR